MLVDAGRVDAQLVELIFVRWTWPFLEFNVDVSEVEGCDVVEPIKSRILRSTCTRLKLVMSTCSRMPYIDNLRLKP